MALACKICVAAYGLRGSEIGALPQTQEELNDHLESVHHIVVQREGESGEQAIQRFIQKHPEAVDCADCAARGAPWTK